MTKKHKLSKNSPAVVLLGKLFDNDDVDEESTAREVFESNEVFYKNHDLVNFRVCFNKMKKAKFGDGMFI